MKDFSLIQWIVQLKERDRLIAVCLVAVAALWGQNQWDKQENKSLQKELIVRADNCAAEKIELLQEQLKKGQLLQGIVDSLARVNLVIISNNNKNIKP